jgi:hypothetical protein
VFVVWEAKVAGTAVSGEIPHAVAVAKLKVTIVTNAVAGIEPS